MEEGGRRVILQVTDGRRLNLPLLGLQKEGAASHGMQEPPAAAKDNGLCQSLKKGI